MIIYNSKIPKWFGYAGMTIYPFIFITDSHINCSKELIKHEQIHLQQQKDWWFIPFFLVYIWDYVCGRIKGLNHNEAYKNIRFEREAYAND